MAHDQRLRDETLWWDEALCQYVAADIFHAEPGSNVNEAKAVCRRCPVREPCAEYALRSKQEYGVWGGLSVEDRRRIYQAEDRK